MDQDRRASSELGSEAVRAGDGSGGKTRFQEKEGLRGRHDLSPIIRPETVHRVQEVLPFGGSRGEVDGLLREVNQPGTEVNAPTPGSPWG